MYCTVWTVHITATVYKYIFLGIAGKADKLKGFKWFRYNYTVIQQNGKDPPIHNYSGNMAGMPYTMQLASRS